MIENLHARENLRTLARRKSRAYDQESVPLTEVDRVVAEGWAVVSSGKQTARIRRDKAPAPLRRDEIWTALHRMEFTHLSGDGGALLSVTVGTGPTVANTLDIVAMDDEVALAIKTQAAGPSSEKEALPSRIVGFAALRQTFTREINRLNVGAQKRQVVLAMYTDDEVVSDEDRRQAAAADVIILDRIDVNYYTSLTAHLGPAARYQFLSDLVPGKAIPGLSITIPAVRSKMGGHNCYTFSISPEYLLKISYVSHRAKGKPSDVDKYQRMVSKARLKRIANYISEDGIFPTNIVVNIDRGRRGRGLRWERARQEEEADQSAATFGWLTIAPSYKAAWIIDGQHRLYAYSGHPRATRSVVSVLAFEDLPPSQQAQLFIDINAQQKSVKQSLLQELYAELHWDSEDAQDRTSAVISKAIQTLGQESDSPLYDRVLLSDTTRTPQRCISLTSMFSVLEKTGFYRTTRRGVTSDTGPLWTDDNERTLRRTIDVVKAWFIDVVAGTEDWWALGSELGGGLAMNDGVTVCLSVLKSVFDHLEGSGLRLVELPSPRLIELVRPFAVELGRYFGARTEDERRGFRALRGVEGQTRGMRLAQAALRERFPDFNPAGLQEFLEREKARTNERGQVAVRNIETALQRLVMEELKDHFSGSSDEWWYEGVPETVRTMTSDRMEKDKNQRGGREYYFNLIDYRAIALANWSVFQPMLAYGEVGKNMQRRTQWLVEVNALRNKVNHGSSGASITQEQLVALQEYEAWLMGQLKALPDVPVEEGGNGGDPDDHDLPLDG